ncbi:MULTISPECIES: alpha-amylase [unclassified Actinomyces]|uniref:alpha-amylase n=1 Tax=unclassified Actinomyces TaxID=2609248 RepID=UPI0013A6A4ED|nr:alpha-amylase [Actinomyces sp. 594]MBW3067915.1 alpha-amylase [Actinomyces sp. 594]NDR54523.1 alpha-amylase [Actinomyces sp. 565]
MSDRTTFGSGGRENPILLQGFAWDLAADSSHWRFLADNAALIADSGVTTIWLPPAYKGQAGVNDVGYGVYDTYDLGEFDQKGTVPTKYGTKDEYVAAVAALRATGMEVLADIVLNHRMGADGVEQVRAVEVDGADRRKPIADPGTITAWTRFTFPGRRGAYSDFTWDHTCFLGTDWDEATRRNSVWLFEGKEWNEDVTDELGNFDYLMGADVDLNNPQVSDELIRWGRWYLETTGVDGVRLDALKHMSREFYRRWLPALREATGREVPAVGEFWSRDAAELCAYLGEEPIMCMFDTPLHYRLYHASFKDRFDLSKIFEHTLVEADPDHAVTFVENHDTQPGQSLQSFVEPGFKPAAYALILLRREGTPCVFWGDLFGTPETGDISACIELPLLMRLRRSLAYGPQHDVFNAADLVGFTREGDDEHPGSGLAVVLSTALAATKRLYVGARHAGERWICAIGGHGAITISGDGSAEFPVGESGLSVYVPASARPIIDRGMTRLVRVR